MIGLNTWQQNLKKSKKIFYLRLFQDNYHSKNYFILEENREQFSLPSELGNEVLYVSVNAILYLQLLTHFNRMPLTIIQSRTTRHR